MVNYINKRIISLVVEIVFMLIVLVSTYFIWDKIDLNKYSSIAGSYAGGDVLDVYYLESENNVYLEISNNNSSKKEYVLYLGVKNNSSEDIKIKYLDNITYLDELDSYEDNNITYYILDNSIINNNETKNYDITLFNNLEISFNIIEM